MPKLKTRVTIAAVTALGALLAIPAAGQAATNFGSRLLNEPTENRCEMIGPCTIVSYIHPAPPEGDPYSGGAPVDGVITKFRTRAWAVMDPGKITFRVGELGFPDPNDKDSALGTAKGTGPTVTIVPDEGAIETPITEVPARVPVRKGQYLAVDITESIGIIYNSNGNKYSYLYAPPLVEGAGPRGSTDAVNELLVAATIEPDADGDGFGDETQDLCPRQKTTQGACDDAKPGVDNVSVSGSTLAYTLGEAATVTINLEQRTPGRKVGKKCVKQTKRNKAKKRCQRVKLIGPIAGTGNAGANQVALPKLVPGAYKVTITARDAAGNETVSVTNFTVKKKKKAKKPKK